MIGAPPSPKRARLTPDFPVFREFTGETTIGCFNLAPHYLTTYALSLPFFAKASIRDAAKLQLPHYIIEECRRLVEMLADEAEGIAAFKAKPAPRFTGR